MPARFGCRAAAAAAAVAVAAVLLGLGWQWTGGWLPAAAWRGLWLLHTAVGAWRGSAPQPAGNNVTVWWHAPFFSHGGYASEAAGLVLGLLRLPQQPLALRISQHGDLFDPGAMQGMQRRDRADLQALALAALRPLPGGRIIVVCHSEPGAWALPQPLFQTSACPPAVPEALLVGRTMWECDRLPREHVRRLSAMEEVWVPSQWQARVFADSGVLSRISVLPEPVDAAFFDPQLHAPLLPPSQLVFGAPAPDGAAAPPFRFLSVFKWEARKGWDVLLAAFLAEFEPRERVELLLLTRPFQGAPDFAAQMRGWAAGRGITGELPRVQVVSAHVPQPQLPGLYAAADAFVLPSRGEGWGRPHAEAMAMGLPVIATKWSGTTAFLDESVGYPLDIEGLADAAQTGAFQGCRWAVPSVRHLRSLMRRVASDRREAAARGRAARQRMAARFSPEAVARQLQALLERSAASPA